jgi:hypothetical protein
VIGRCNFNSSASGFFTHERDEDPDSHHINIEVLQKLKPLTPIGPSVRTQPSSPRGDIECLVLIAVPRALIFDEPTTIMSLKISWSGGSIRVMAILRQLRPAGLSMRAWDILEVVTRPKNSN